MDDEEDTQRVAFSGAALKAKLADIFDLDRQEEDAGEDDDDTNLEQGRSKVTQRLGIGATEVQINDEREDGRLGKLASASKAQAKRASKRPRSALEGFVDDDESEEEEISKASSVRKRSQRDSLVHLQVEDPKLEVSKKKKKKNKKSKAERSEVVDGEPVKDIKETIDSILGETVPRPQEELKEAVDNQGINGDQGDGNSKKVNKLGKNSNNEPIDRKKQGRSSAQEQGEENTFVRKRTKRRSKQKNFKKDTRPKGTWLKSQGTFKDIGPGQAPPIPEGHRWN